MEVEQVNYIWAAVCDQVQLVSSATLVTPDVTYVWSQDLALVTLATIHCQTLVRLGPV